MPDISFDATPSEWTLVRQIATRAHDRARKMGISYALGDIQMDLVACNANGCPIDFAKLAAFDDFNFGHDVFGIRRFLDRTTGELCGCFVPRSARHQLTSSAVDTLALIAG